MGSTYTQLAGAFAGLNRMTAPQNLDASQSPDTTDARSSNLRTGALGPRNGRVKSLYSANPIVGLGTLNAVSGRFRVLADNSGAWKSSLLTWPGLNAVTVPADLTGMDGSVRARFVQYKQRLYGFNGRNRMRTLDGTSWTNAGIDRSNFTPTLTAGTAPTAVTILSASNSLGVATLTTLTAHGFSVGDIVLVALGDSTYNGTFAVASTPTSTTFTYALTPNTSTTPVLIQQAYRGVFGGPTGTGYTAINSNGHGLSQGNLINVTMSSDATYSGVQYVYSVIDANNFVYLNHGAADDSPGVLHAVTGSFTLYPAGTPNTQQLALSNCIHDITSNVATVETAVAHGFQVGQLVEIDTLTLSPGAVAAINGVSTITALPTTTRFSFAVTAANSGAVSNGGTARAYNAGTVTKQVGPGGTLYRYLVAPTNSKHLDVIGRSNEGIPSQISLAIAISNQTITVGNIPATHPDPQVDFWNIYRNKSGVYSTDLTTDQQDFFYIGQVPIGTTTFADNVNDIQLTGANRLRFDQNTPPAFKFAAIYGERMFGCGFDPINAGTATVNADTTKVDFAGVTLPDGMIGTWFKKDGDVNQYRVVAQTSTQVTLDRAFVGALAAAIYSLFRDPYRIYYSEFQDVEAWGPNGEGLRFEVDVPGQQTPTGLMAWQGSLLVFTATAIYTITGKGPNRTDIRILPDPTYNGLGAVSGDSIIRVDNDVYFMSLRGPCAMVNGDQPQLIGVVLNTDWIDPLTTAELSLAVSGSDDKDIYFSVPKSGQRLNSKTFRYERFTKTWWEETEMCPLAFVREDAMNGFLSQLYYIQGNFLITPNTGTFDLASPINRTTGIMPYSNGVFSTGSGFPSTNLALVECYVRMYATVSGVKTFVARRRIVAADSGISTGDYFLVWSSDATLPDSGPVVGTYDTIEIGNIEWTWTTKTFSAPAKMCKAMLIHISFDTKNSSNAQKYDIVEGVLSTNTFNIPLTQKAAQWEANRSGRDYACKIKSRDGAVMRDIVVEQIIEEGTN